jgi:hypothetical protein
MAQELHFRVLADGTGVLGGGVLITEERLALLQSVAITAKDLLDKRSALLDDLKMATDERDRLIKSLLEALRTSLEGLNKIWLIPISADSSKEAPTPAPSA